VADWGGGMFAGCSAATIARRCRQYGLLRIQTSRRSS